MKSHIQSSPLHLHLPSFSNFGFLLGIIGILHISSTFAFTSSSCHRSILSSSWVYNITLVGSKELATFDFSAIPEPLYYLLSLDPEATQLLH